MYFILAANELEEFLIEDVVCTVIDIEKVQWKVRQTLVFGPFLFLTLFIKVQLKLTNCYNTKFFNLKLYYKAMYSIFIVVDYILIYIWKPFFIHCYLQEAKDWYKNLVWFFMGDGHNPNGRRSPSKFYKILQNQRWANREVII